MKWGNRRRGQPKRQMVGQRTPRWRSALLLVLGLAVAALAAFGIAQLVSRSGGSSSSSAPPPVPALAVTVGQATGQPVEGVLCDNGQGTGTRFDAHLAVFVDGQPRSIPAGVGIPNPILTETVSGAKASATSCEYWLHTSGDDGVLHVTAPQPNAAFSLAEFFAIWAQPLSSGEVGPARGPVTAYVDGERVNGDPGNITIGPHTVIQLDVGSDVPFQSYDFSG